MDLVNFLLLFLLSTLRVSTPLILAALGGLISERAGVAQIALEGMMLLGAVVAAIVAHFTGSAWLGLIAGAFSAMLLAMLKAFFVITLRTEQIVAGAALNIFVAGFAPFLTKVFFDSTGQTPALIASARFHVAPLYFIFVLICVIYYLEKKTILGLWLKFAGEAPAALLVSGISPLRVRWWALIICGGMAGLGGASLSLYLASAYSPLMTAGRGFIALAAIIFARWKVLPTVGVCLLFGASEALQIRLQGVNTGIPSQFIQTLPYVLTIAVLAGFFGKSRAPKALGQQTQNE